MCLDEEEEDFVTEEVEITLTETKEISSQNAGDSETLLVRRRKFLLNFEEQKRFKFACKFQLMLW